MAKYMKFTLPIDRAETSVDKLITHYGNDTYIHDCVRAQMDYITDIMNKHGTPEVLADKLGVSSHLVRHWYHGTRRLPIHTARRLEMILNEKNMQFWKYLKAYW